jgi:hypothetical protein
MQKGPQRGQDGSILPYTILGDVEDYEEMARLDELPEEQHKLSEHVRHVYF